MRPDFELQLEERLADRVIVSVLLGPGPSGAAEIDGVSVSLVGRTGEILSNRLLLPIAGVIRQGIVSTVELRSLGALPPGARVSGSAWRGADQWDTSCPADPGTQLEAHMRGLSPLRPRSDEVIEPLTCGEREALALAFPWLQTCRAEPAPPTVMEPEPDPCDDDSLRAYCRDLGLDDDETEWLESLLDED